MMQVKNVITRWLDRFLPPPQSSLAFQQLAKTQHMLMRREIDFWTMQIQQHPICADLLLIAAHHNGYLRAAVLWRLALQPSSEHIPIILARLNDWVPEVRLAARSALRSHLQEQFFSIWLQAWPQVRHLYHCHRTVHRHVVMEVEEFLLSSKHKGSICQVLHHQDRAHAREACRLVAHAQLLPKGELIAYAIASRDRQIAGCAPAWICELAPEERKVWLERGVHAPLKQVRQSCQQALQRLRQTDGRGEKISSRH